MFVDEAEITVKGGDGGTGIVSFFPMKQGPDGGNGGIGGTVYFRLNNQMNSLHKFKEIRDYQAESGGQGGSYRKTGANGEDLFLEVPNGTTLHDVTTGEEVEINEQNPQVLVARGGKGGLGNDAFKTATRQVPRRSEPGQPGEERQIKLILKLIADYGFIGLPNAGKSSLLNELTAANVKTANYPFTTLEPNLGVVNGKIIADIPGLIEGASAGKGLGIKFLKHIEKVKLLLHCISVESDDVKKDYQTVMKELESYNPTLLKKDMIVLLTKHDLADKKDVSKKVKILKKLNPQVYPISIHDFDSLELLKKVILES